MNELIRVKVASKTLLVEGIAAYDLISIDETALPYFGAGSHIDVHVPNGPVRQYSLCDLPGVDRRYRIAVMRDPLSRGGSVRMIEKVQDGDELFISRPRNHFAVHEGEAPAVLFAGGIGITPIRCMTLQLASEGRPFELHYCGRSRDRMAFVDQLNRCSFAANIFVHVDDGGPSQRLDAQAVLRAHVAESHLYVCGPKGFMNHILCTARELGWAEDRLHCEHFGAAPIDHTIDGPFELEIRSTGIVITVAAGQSAAQALIDAEIDLPISCEQGACGTCVTKVLSGIPDHRDVYLTEAEHLRNGLFTPCCSRSRTSRLVLDL